MTFATGTSTTAESIALYRALEKLAIMLRDYDAGSASLGKVGRFSLADIDAAVTATSNAITAANAV